MLNILALVALFVCVLLKVDVVAAVGAIAAAWLLMPWAPTRR